MCISPVIALIILALGLACTLYTLLAQFRQWVGSRGLPSKVRRECWLKVLASLMGVFVFSGALLFCWTFANLADQAIETEHIPLYSFPEFLFRSLLGSLGLFLMDLDDNILELIDEKIPKESKYLKGWLIVQTVLSFTCTISLLLQLLASRLLAYVRLWWVAHFSRRRHLYLFFSLNEPARLLASSIVQEDRHALIVFVVNPAIDEDEKEDLHSVMRLFASQRKDYVLDSVPTQHTYFTFTSGTLDALPPDTEPTDVFTALNLPKVRRLLKRMERRSDGCLHVFLLSEQEDQNVDGALSLCRDELVRRIGSRCTIHCLARMSSVNRVVEDMAAQNGVEVKLIDSSYTSVELLKRDPTSQPVRFVDISRDNPATVCSPFYALVIGFDEIGQDALSYLYEFAAFPSHLSTDEHVLRSPCHLLAIDRCMHSLAPHYLSVRPALRAQLNPDKSPIVRLEQVDTDSESFHARLLPSLAHQLNYVVIAVGEDDKGMALAVRILQVLRQQRTDAQMQHVCIFVKAYRRDKEDYLQRIADHYNEGAGCLPDQPLIKIFGKGSDIFSYSMVIDDAISQKGRVYYEAYQGQARAQVPEWDQGEPLSWEQRRNALIGKRDGHTGQPIPLLDKLRELRRKEGQDVCDALHADTKIHLLNQALQMDEDFLQRYFKEATPQRWRPDRSGSHSHIVYPRLTSRENLIIRHLAWLEHMRWNASHEILGYQLTQDGDPHRCDERKRRHNCLRPWEQLDEEARLASTPDETKDYKANDYCVVDTTIFLYSQNQCQ